MVIFENDVVSVFEVYVYMVKISDVYFYWIYISDMYISIQVSFWASMSYRLIYSFPQDFSRGG